MDITMVAAIDNGNNPSPKHNLEPHIKHNLGENSNSSVFKCNQEGRAKGRTRKG
jgi:hypothetical protein